MSKRLPLSAAASVGVMIVASVVAGGGCITEAPPSIPQASEPRPTILQSSVYPPADQLLEDWPSDDTFVVSVQLQDPQEQFSWAVFVDYATKYAQALTNGETNPNPSPQDSAQGVSGANSAGIAPVSFRLTPPVPASSCHTIEFLVVRSFAVLAGAGTLWHVPDPAGSDSVTWLYTAGGGLDGCPVYDAGIFEDGATPPDGPFDAPAEADAP